MILNAQKRMFIRILCLSLAGSSLLSCFTACGNPGGQGGITSDGEITEEMTEADETVDSLKDNLPEDLDYGGETITIISRNIENWTAGELTVEKQNGDIVNDAVFERNSVVQKRLNVELVNIEDTSSDANAVPNKVSLSVSSGSHDYDICAAACYTTVSEALKGTFYNLRETEYIDFEKPWWSQGLNEVLEYKGMQFAATGTICLSMYRFAFVTLFNKRLFDNAQVVYPYDTVSSGEWTLDYQASIIPVFHTDNGNGIQDEESDVYGFVTSNYLNVDPYWSACDIPLVVKNSDGEYEYVLDVNRLSNVCDKLLNILYGMDDATYIYPMSMEDQNQIRRMFSSGNAAMTTLRLLEVEAGDVRNMEDSYGVLPMPKYDSKQNQYKTFLHDQFTVMSIPVTAHKKNRTNMISAVLEAMSVEGSRYVTPAYYETALRYKHLNDPESYKMMNIIYDNVYIDAGIIYTASLNTVHDNFRVIMCSEENTVGSTFKSKKRPTVTALEKLIESLDNLKE